MKPILSYYGGKQSIAKRIVSWFPKNYTDLHYVEPFAGGLAVLFKKRKSNLESINDLDNNLYRFYKVFKESPKELEKRLQNFILHESLYKDCKKIVSGKVKPKDEIEFAFSYFVNINAAFSNIPHGGLGYSKKESMIPKKIHNKISLFQNMLNRFKEVQIFNRDALSFIKLMDSKKTLFYIDPPYPDTDQGDYKGYTREDFNNLIELLKNIKGRFLLSCYKKDFMKFDKKWICLYRETKLTAGGRKNGFISEGQREESLTKNFIW